MSKSCDCLAHYKYQVKAGKKKSDLIRIKCRSCGKEFLSNVNKELCFDCAENEIKSPEKSVS